MGNWLRNKLPVEANVENLLAERAFVYEDGERLTDTDPYRPQCFIWFHRELREEAEVPGQLEIVYRDDRLVVTDKPAFLSSIPRGRHVVQSAVVRLRSELGLPEATPVHRLDRVTSGLLVFTTEKQWRGAYQTLFQNRQVQKMYRALAPVRSDITFPRTVENHIYKQSGIMQAEIVPDAKPNARSRITLETDLNTGFGVYRLEPETGRTHQLRLHMNSLGLPIVGDPLYPRVRDIGIDDFSEPLQLLASEIEFTDPVDGSLRNFTSGRGFPLVP